MPVSTAGTRLIWQTHYPSWGLETRMMRPLVIRLEAGFSLPLMGIGNPPFVGRAWSAVIHNSSLPLMGIGNAGDDLTDQSTQIGELITPHGDWKPLRDSHRNTAATTHYPSWGLETRRQFRSWRRSSHYPHGEKPRYAIYGYVILITPHGDWKLAHVSHRAASADHALITPHGDWKPRPHRHGQAVAVAYHDLITPHGDWKLFRGSGPGVAPALLLTASHYPSWGLETTTPIMAKSATASRLLITPHGDWKPLFSIAFLAWMFHGTSQNNGTSPPHLRLSPLPRVVLRSGAHVTRQRMDQFLPCHLSSS